MTTDLKPLSAEELDEWEKKVRFPLDFNGPGLRFQEAHDVLRLIAQAQRALKLEAENADLTAVLETAEKQFELITQCECVQACEVAREGLAAIRKRRWVE